MSSNPIEFDEKILEILQNLKNLSCLYLKNSPFVKEFKFYRRKFINCIKNLKFLDEKPVFEEERRLAEVLKNKLF